MNTKYVDLQQYSNPSIVLQRTEDLFGPNVDLRPSTRSNKKYMIYLNNKWIHFGQMYYEDFTKHLDEDRRERFRTRNAQWIDRPYDSAGFLSYVLLW